MIAVVVAAIAGIGVYLLIGASSPRSTDENGEGAVEAGAGLQLVRAARDWRAQAGLASVSTTQLLSTVAAVMIGGAAVALTLFGTVVAAVAGALFAATFPLAAFRQRRRSRILAAQDAWPRMIEELRLLTSSVGRSLPQALFEVGAAGPEVMRPAFAAAQREWMLTTDFERTLAVLRDQLADPTCDATCETLLIAHELGGTGVDRRLADLAQDRRDDVAYRKDVRARQSGVRFARRFVLLVPLGMAAAGLAIGNGRAAYSTPMGQLAVLGALAMTALCWQWAGRMLRLPTERRVFDR